MPIKKTSPLSNTAALIATPFSGLNKEESRTQSVRKIENGYVVCDSSYKDGRYESKEYYSKEPPQAAEENEGQTAMRKAVDYMSRNGTV